MDEPSKNPWESLNGSEHRTATGHLTWSRETSRMKVSGGWIYKTSTTHYNASGIVTACSESLCPVMDPKPARK